MRFRSVVAVLFPIAATACGPHASAIKPAPIDSPIVATMGRAQCFGTCPVYELAVHEDGTVDYAGHENVKQAGYARWKISREEVARLQRAFANAGYLDLSDCEESHDSMDLSWTTTSFQTAAQHKQLRHYDGCATSQGIMLFALEECVDDVTDSDRVTRATKLLQRTVKELFLPMLFPSNLQSLPRICL